MIYLDCAATSLQKPQAVYRAAGQAMRTMASPGRGAHRPAFLAAETAYRCREELAALFGVSNPEQIVFTFNATHGLNVAISDLVSSGDRVVVSGYEHNSVMRPLYQLGADVRVVRTNLFDDNELLRGFAAQLPRAKAAVCTAMSNVFGYILPIMDIAHLCHKYDVPLIIDASQLAGCGELNFEALNAAYMAMPGHKGLLGPQGTGVLICGRVPKPFLSGGSGSESRQMQMPDILPDRVEAGTHNIPGIAGLLEGVKFLRRMGVDTVARHERNMLEEFVKQTEKLEGMELFYTQQRSKQGGVLSVRYDGIDSETLTQALADVGVGVRGGLHCAPSAHETVGTIHSGTVRFSFSPFITFDEVKRASQLLKLCVNKLKT